MGKDDLARKAYFQIGNWIAPIGIDFEKGVTMRSELVFGATKYVSNRYLLTKLAAKVIRAFHRPNTRIEETANEVFGLLSLADPMAPRPISEQYEDFALRRAS